MNKKRQVQGTTETHAGAGAGAGAGKMSCRLGHSRRATGSAGTCVYSDCADFFTSGFINCKNTFLKWYNEI